MLEFLRWLKLTCVLQPGEDLKLNQERDKLQIIKISDTLTNAYTMLDNDEFSSLSNVRSAMNDMEIGRV